MENWHVAWLRTSCLAADDPLGPPRETDVNFRRHIGMSQNRQLQGRPVVTDILNGSLSDLVKSPFDRGIDLDLLGLSFFAAFP